MSRVSGLYGRRLEELSLVYDFDDVTPLSTLHTTRQEPAYPSATIDTIDVNATRCDAV